MLLSLSTAIFFFYNKENASAREQPQSARATAERETKKMYVDFFSLSMPHPLVFAFVKSPAVLISLTLWTKIEGL